MAYYPRYEIDLVAWHPLEHGNSLYGLRDTRCPFPAPDKNPLQIGEYRIYPPPLRTRKLKKLL